MDEEKIAEAIFPYVIELILFLILFMLYNYVSGSILSLSVATSLYAFILGMTHYGTDRLFPGRKRVPTFPKWLGICALISLAVFVLVKVTIWFGWGSDWQR